MTATTVRSFLDKISEDRIRAHIRALEGIRHPEADPAALKRAEGYVSSVLQPLGYEMEEHSFEDGGREYRNILATTRGNRFPEERVMVIAHFDTVGNSPGADDNASGVAALLELARVLRSVRFERTVQWVAVNLEERGPEGARNTRITRGSHALAAHARGEGWQILGVIVLESIAYAGETIVQKTPEGLPIALPEAGDFIGVIGNEASTGVVGGFMAAVQRYQIPLPSVPLVVPGKGEIMPDTRRSDHAPFWDRDYPAIMLTDTANFRNPHYHQPSDTLDTLNLAFATEVCRAVGGLVADMAGYGGVSEK